MKYLVKLRREIAPIKPECEQLDGKVFEFQKGWLIDVDENPMYAGEMAMIPRDVNWPLEAPAWVSSGDLTIPAAND